MAALGASLVDNPVGPGLSLEQGEGEGSKGEPELVADDEERLFLISSVWRSASRLLGLCRDGVVYDSVVQTCLFGE